MPLAEFRDWLGTFTEDVPQLEGQKWAQALRSQAPSGERHDPSTPDTAFMRAEWSAKSSYLGLSLFISGDADMPKPIFVLSMLLLVAYGHAAEEHKIIAVSEWSKPVESHDRFLRARCCSWKVAPEPMQDRGPRFCCMWKWRMRMEPGANPYAPISTRPRDCSFTSKMRTANSFPRLRRGEAAAM